MSGHQTHHELHHVEAIWTSSYQNNFLHFIILSWIKQSKIRLIQHRDRFLRVIHYTNSHSQSDTIRISHSNYKPYKLLTTNASRNTMIIIQNRGPYIFLTKSPDFFTFYKNPINQLKVTTQILENNPQTRESQFIETINLDPDLIIRRQLSS